MACTSACPDQSCPSYGACLRRKGVKAVMVNSAAGRDYTTEKRWHKELDAYESAKRQGIQPESTRLADTNAAVELSNMLGTAVQA